MRLVESLFVVLLIGIGAVYAWELGVVLPGRKIHAPLLKLAAIATPPLHAIGRGIDAISFYIAEIIRYLSIAIGILLCFAIPYLVMQAWLIMGLFLAVLAGPTLFYLLCALRPRSLREQ